MNQNDNKPIERESDKEFGAASMGLRDDIVRAFDRDSGKEVKIGGIDDLSSLVELQRRLIEEARIPNLFVHFENGKRETRSLMDLIFKQ